MEIVRRNYPDLGVPIGALCHATLVGNLLFISGMTARETDAEHGDIATQTEAILKKLRLVLEAEGASPKDVAKVTVFVTELGDFQDIHQVRRRFFGDTFPASTLVEVTSLVLPHLKIEIEAIAVVPGKE